MSLIIFNINILVLVFLIFCEAKHNFWSIYAKRDSAWALTNLGKRELIRLIIFPAVGKSRTSCYHLVTRLTRPTDSQEVVPTSLISSARNKLLTS